MLLEVVVLVNLSLSSVISLLLLEQVNDRVQLTSKAIFRYYWVCLRYNIRSHRKDHVTNSQTLPIVQ